MCPNQHHDDDLGLQVTLNMIEPRSRVDVFEIAVREHTHGLCADDEEHHAEDGQSCSVQPTFWPPEAQRPST